jgi:hypothetical protein
MCDHERQQSMNNEETDRRVRAEVYDVTMRSGTPPPVARIGDALQLTPDDVRASLQRLADARMLVLQRDSGEILMANPFSAVPTPFPVNAAGLSSYGNCIWDALGIPAMLQCDAEIDTSCADCGTAAHISVRGGSVIGEGLMHFAVPARLWWKDIVFN